MRISKMLGATMIAGAIATGASAGVAGAADAPGKTGANTDASGGEPGTVNTPTATTRSSPTRAP